MLWIVINQDKKLEAILTMIRSMVALVPSGLSLKIILTKESMCGVSRLVIKIHYETCVVFKLNLKLLKNAL